MIFTVDTARIRDLAGRATHDLTTTDFVNALATTDQKTLHIGFDTAAHFRRIYELRRDHLRSDRIEAPGLADAVDRLDALPPTAKVGVLGLDDGATNFVAFVDEEVSTLLALLAVPARQLSPPPPGIGIGG